MATTGRRAKTSHAVRVAGNESDHHVHHAITSACDGYLLRAAGAVERTIGLVHRFNAMQCVAAYVQACATLHAAQLTAAALDRNTVAIKALAKMMHR